jgi:hypothetical protein
MCPCSQYTKEGGVEGIGGSLYSAGTASAGAKAALIAGTLRGAEAPLFHGAARIHAACAQMVLGKLFAGAAMRSFQRIVS